MRNVAVLGMDVVPDPISLGYGVLFLRAQSGYEQTPSAWELLLVPAICLIGVVSPRTPIL